MIQIENITFSFPMHDVLHDLSLDLPAGEIGTLIGPSGSGKTTFLKLLTGLLKPDSGEISINQKKGLEAHSDVAYLMQDDVLLPWRTILNNLLLVDELGIHKRNRSDEALAYLHEMGLLEWKDAYPHELSGGMRKRAALARVILQKKPVLLLDEPFAALDVILREQLYDLLQRIRKQYGTTILMVTHDFRDAISLSDRIFFLSNGKIGQQWKIDHQLRQDPYRHQTTLDEMRSAIQFSQPKT